MHWILVAPIALIALAVGMFVWSVLHDEPPRPRPFGPLSGPPPVAYRYVDPERCQYDPNAKLPEPVKFSSVWDGVVKSGTDVDYS